MKVVRYHEAAESELFNAVGYLELRTTGLGRRFLAEIRKAELFVSKFPGSSEQIRPGIRKRLLRKFRYSLIYSVEGNDIVILAVAHASRRPEYWVDRTSPE